ncbi:hypothetical protein AVEN_135030-1 [Araneus ventricosus]|uniref:Uncharacterized protein n=1 Tax=Araneus ventricosus TaxID=182803 RepID=A0A4Y2VWM3_ARAVE|nr:hypothetical protein AVEN_135030-1 [Araneus ventricosus]
MAQLGDRKSGRNRRTKEIADCQTWHNSGQERRAEEQRTEIARLGNGIGQEKKSRRTDKQKIADCQTMLQTCKRTPSKY